MADGDVGVLVCYTGLSQPDRPGHVLIGGGDDLSVRDAHLKPERFEELPQVTIPGAAHKVNKWTLACTMPGVACSFLCCVIRGQC